jgi:hypothetical protein
VTGNRGVSVDRLREIPASEFEVEASELFDKHVDRIDPACVADVFAVAELNLPGYLGSQLGAFVRRASRELGDLPEVARAVFVTRLAELPAAKIPANLRAVVARLPGGASRAAIWATTPPEVFALPVPVPVSRQAPVAGRVVTPELADARMRRAPTREQREDDARRQKERAPRVRAPKPVPEEDPRKPWMRTQILERLSSFANRDRGLLESVLISSIRAAAARPDVGWVSLTQDDVKGVVRALGREGRIILRSGRWVFVR